MTARYDEGTIARNHKAATGERGYYITPCTLRVGVKITLLGSIRSGQLSSSSESNYFKAGVIMYYAVPGTALVYGPAHAAESFARRTRFSS